MCARSNCFFLGGLCRSTWLQFYSDFSGLYPDSITQKVSKSDGPRDSIGSALIRVQQGDSLFQFSERLLHTVSSESRHFAASDLSTLICRSYFPFFMAQRNPQAEAFREFRSSGPC